MTDCPTNEMVLQGIPDERQPHTVLMMLSDDMRGDECSAADWIRRVWVWGTPDDVGIEQMITQANDKLAEMFGWTDLELGLESDEIEERKAALEPVAIYPGHIFDIYQP